MNPRRPPPPRMRKTILPTPLSGHRTHAGTAREMPPEAPPAGYGRSPRERRPRPMLERADAGAARARSCRTRTIQLRPAAWVPRDAAHERLAVGALADLLASLLTAGSDHEPESGLGLGFTPGWSVHHRFTTTTVPRRGTCDACRDLHPDLC